MPIKYPDLTHLDSVTDDVEFQMCLEEWVDHFSEELQSASNDLGHAAFKDLGGQLLFIIATALSTGGPNHVAENLRRMADFTEKTLAPIHYAAQHSTEIH